jgi:hypothetical protein
MAVVRMLDHRAITFYLWALVALQLGPFAVVADLNPVDNFCGRWYSQCMCIEVDALDS